MRPTPTPGTAALFLFLAALLFVVGVAGTAGTFLSAHSVGPDAAPAVASAAGPPQQLSAPLQLNWTVTAGDVTVNGVTSSALLLNGLWHGPTLDLAIGQSFLLTLTNAQPLPISIHFHGLKQQGTPRADGAARANAQALRQGQTATLSLLAAPAGTHFYHAHAGLGALLGLHGAVVVRPPAASAEARALPPYDAELSEPLVFSDFWNASFAAIVGGLLAPGSAFAWPGNPDALLLNAAPAEGLVLVAPPLPPAAAATLRLRLVGAAALSFLSVAAEGHNLTIVEADGGGPLEPLSTPAVDLNAGERLSVLLTPNAAARAAGWLWLVVATRHRSDGPTARVALRLPTFAADGGAPQQQQQQQPLPAPPAAPLVAQQPAWNDTGATVALMRRFRAAPGAPAVPPAAPGEPTVLLGTQNRLGGLMRWSVDNVTFAYPGDPLLNATAGAGGSGASGGGVVVVGAGASAPAATPEAASEASAELSAVEGDGEADPPPMLEMAAAAARAAAAAAAAGGGGGGVGASAAASEGDWVSPVTVAAAAPPPGAAAAPPAPAWAGVAAAAAAPDPAAAAPPPPASYAPLGSRFARSVQAAMGTQALGVPSAGSVVDVVLQNAPALNGVLEQHPWHLHGHSFAVLAVGAGDWPGAAGAASAGLVSPAPPWRDVVTLPPGGWVWLRFTADNAGVWPFHCHILFHLFMGACQGRAPPHTPGVRVPPPPHTPPRPLPFPVVSGMMLQVVVAPGLVPPVPG